VGACSRALTDTAEDRALTHINKKGRPVSQCPHCRGLRKARSTHVQCECGTKPHTKEECSDNEGKGDTGDFHSDAGSDTGAPEPKACCCSHGMRCTCALKKEYLDPVPETDLPPIPPRRSASSSKPRLLKAGSSENGLTVFTNGHHKPVHKHNDSAHKCGLPYKIPIPHSVPGSEYARRSTDSLPLIRKKEEAHSQLHESISSAQQDVRLVRSEHGSPEPRPRSGTNGQVPPLDLSYPAYNDCVGPYAEEYSQSPRSFDNYYNAEEQPPVLSAGLGMPPVDWSTLDLDNGAFSAAYSQPPSYASFDHNNVSRPGLTTSSSGDLSDVGDYISNNCRGSPIRPDMPSSSAEDLSYNRLSSSSFTSLPQTSMLSSSNLNSLDYETFLNTTASPPEFDEPSADMPLKSEAFAKHGFTVHDAQKLAHPDTPTEAMGGLSLPTPEEDHIWAKRLSPDEGPCVQPTKVENHRYQ